MILNILGLIIGLVGLWVSGNDLSWWKSQNNANKILLIFVFIVCGYVAYYNFIALFMQG